MVFFPCVLYQDSMYVLWYGTNVGNICKTGRATSVDGIRWSKDNRNPVLDVGPPGSWEEFGAWLPRVIREGSRFTMYYQGDSIAPFTRWNIGRATSTDGRVWQKDGSNPVLRVGPTGSWESDFIGPGTVMFDGSTYRMWYDGISGVWPGISDAVGYATSSDGIHWTKFPDNPVCSAGAAGAWDDYGVGYNVCVIFDSGFYHMWYTGNTLRDLDGTSGIGYAVSRDGIHWRKYPKNPVLRAGASGTWESHVYGPAVLSDASGFKMWYGGTPPSSDFGYIGYATAPRSSAPIVPSSDSVDFGNVPPGTGSDTTHLRIENWGFTTLIVSSISTGGSEFQICDGPAMPLTVPPFEEFDLHLIFRTSQPGVTILDSLSIFCNDSATPRATVRLRGRGSGLATPAGVGPIYGISASPAGATLFSIDRTKGDAIPLAQLTPHPPPTIHGFALRPSDRTMYAAYSTSSETYLYRVSATFGDLGPAGSIPLGGVTAMAFSASDELYLAGSEGKIYRAPGIGVNPVWFCSPGVQFTGLAFSPATGVLWGSAHDTLYTVDAVTGATRIVGSGLPGLTHSSIAFGSLGTLYGLYDNALVIIDHATGKVDVIGPTSLSGLQSIAMRNDSAAADVPASLGLPQLAHLYQNYPNPFNPATLIRYDLPAVSEVRLVVYDILGREVAVLENGKKAPGSYEVKFNEAGLPSGVYIYRLTAGSFMQTNKMVLVK
jgi:hypothetical protein